MARTTHDAIYQAKYEKLLDLLRRATANGTHVEVAGAIAVNWEPSYYVDGDGKLMVKVSRS